MFLKTHMFPTNSSISKVSKRGGYDIVEIDSEEESDSEEEITKAEEETVQNSKFKTPEAASIKLKTKKDLKIIRSQYPHLQINPVSWPSDAEGSAAKKEHKKSEAKTEAKP